MAEVEGQGKGVSTGEGGAESYLREGRVMKCFWLGDDQARGI